MKIPASAEAALPAEVSAHRSSTLSPTASVAVTGCLVLAGTAHFVTGYMLAATANLFILLVGFTLRHRSRRAHAAFMSLGVLSDLILVLMLQFQRHAIQTAISFRLSAWNQAHILASTTAIALYIPMVVMGVMLFRQRVSDPGSRLQTLHRRLGWTTLIFRTVGFFLMFSMLGHGQGTGG